MSDLFDLAGFEGVTPGEALRLPEARGRRVPRASPDFEVEVIRPLGEDDLEMLTAPPPALPTGSLKEIRSQHHQIARLLATAKTAVEVSALTGYTPEYVRRLADDPAFQELLDYYAAQVKELVIEGVERLKTMGLTAADEMQRRLEEEPEKFTRRDLLDVIDMGLVKPGLGANRGAGGPGVEINVQFVAPGTASGTYPAGPELPIVEGVVLDSAERVK